jgi:hypothetical protein
MGHVEVLYVPELLGIILIGMGYRWNIRQAPLASRARTEVALGATTWQPDRRFSLRNLSLRLSPGGC